MSRKPSLSVTKKMRKLVSLYHISGQSQKSFAQSHGLTEGKLYYWIKKFSKKELSSPEASNTFIPIDISEPEESSCKTILIRMPNGLEIEIPI